MPGSVSSGTHCILLMLKLLSPSGEDIVWCNYKIVLSKTINVKGSTNNLEKITYYEAL